MLSVHLHFKHLPGCHTARTQHFSSSEARKWQGGGAVSNIAGLFPSGALFLCFGSGCCGEVLWCAVLVLVVPVSLQQPGAHPCLGTPTWLPVPTVQAWQMVIVSYLPLSFIVQIECYTRNWSFLFLGETFLFPPTLEVAFSWIWCLLYLCMFLYFLLFVSNIWYRVFILT